jgi:hypothetical protein
LSQATGTAQPTLKAGANGINGLKVAQFDGTTDRMATAAFASPTAGVSVFAVVQFRVVPAAFAMIASHAAGATWVTPFARWALRANSTGAKIEAWVEDASVSPGNFATSTSATDTVAGVRGVVYDQTNIALYKDGVADGSNARSGVLTSSTQPLWLGGHADSISAGEWLDAKVGELVYCSGGLSAGNISSLSGYFRGKWGTP